MTRREESSASAPKFGEWGGNDVPYTLYFENARKKKDQGKRLSTTDLQEDPNAFAKAPSLRTAPPAVEPTSQRPKQRFTSDEEYLHQAAFIPMRHVADRHRFRQESPRRMPGDQTSSIDPGRRPNQLVAERGLGPANIPLHWNAEGPAVPVFGKWNEKDPSMDNNYSGIFENLRREKKSTLPNATPQQTEDKPAKAKAKYPPMYNSNMLLGVFMAVKKGPLPPIHCYFHFINSNRRCGSTDHKCLER
ncbi:unnamed protein product [Spirodela intermedia]|uniref:RIN4 pathogenic type III effector avirulence factor Avr cleavage site domain-containing protein n=1 Tax=Spirodela intermedia TaxID=51605 RepID=A0A7I8KS15_SPIIN|nr:unnamed protein product [Spirodela intermedia]